MNLNAQVLPVECATVAKTSWVNILQQKVVKENDYHNNKTAQLTQIPIQIHLMVKSNGFSALTIQQIRTEMDSVNFFYASANMFFYECSAPEIIYDDSLYDYEYNEEESILLSQHYTNDIINLYFPNTASINGTLVCGYSQFPPSMDYAVVEAPCARNGSTLAHELGHYFGLFHTHGDFSHDELVDGSNCASEGDYICDTPADPTLSSSNVNTSCVYFGTVIDGNSMLYTPDVSNVMSYSRKYCRNMFSPDQYGIINSTMQFERGYLFCSSVTGVKTHDQSDYKLFPNPGNNTLNISLAKEEKICNFKIFNSVGACVYMNYFTLNTFEINTEELSAGIYFYVIKTENNSYTGKWIKSE